jgi:phosphatidylglycerol:prolipoprotein diacylglycerol transferase
MSDSQSIESINPPDSSQPERENPAWLDALVWETVAASYWLDPGERGKPYTARIRFTGRRLGVTGKPAPGDRFDRVETVDPVVPGSGPVSVTTLALGVNPGDWVVSAEPLAQRSDRRANPGGGRPRPVAQAPLPGEPSMVQSLIRWGTPLMSARLPGPLHSRLRPFARVPGSVIGSWPALVLLGVLAGLIVQALLLGRAHLNPLPVLGLSVAAVVVGLIGAKLWFLVLTGRVSAGTFSEGLCIQGFIVGTAVVLTGGLILLHLPIGTFVDASATGLFFGMAIGRPGCFLTGCCAGRPTASRWGLWASDRRVGARRIPIQLWEALLCLTLALVMLLVGLQGTINVPGTIAVGGLAAYTLGRQVLFRFRVEPRRSRVGLPLVVAIATVVIASDALCWMVTCL